LRRGGAQGVQHIRLCLALPYHVTQHRLVDGAELLIQEYAGLLTLPQIHEGDGDKIATEQCRLLGSIETKLHSPDLRHHLLLGIEIDQFSEHPVVGILQRHPDDRILRGRHDMLVTQPGAGDPASVKAEDAGAYGIPAAIVSLGRNVLIFLLERDVIVIADVVVDGGDVGLKSSGENKPRDVQIAHGRTPLPWIDHSATRPSDGNVTCIRTRCNLN
jgi:hypothetical protein